MPTATETILALAVLWLGYAYFGYPALLAVLVLAVFGRSICGNWARVMAGRDMGAWAISSAQHRLRSRKKVVRKKITSGPALPGKLAECQVSDPAMRGGVGHFHG